MVKSSFKHTRAECEFKGDMCLGASYLVCQSLVNYYFSFVYCLLDLSCGECNVISLFVLCCSVNGSVCFVCCVSDRIYE